MRITRALIAEAQANAAANYPAHKAMALPPMSFDADDPFGLAAEDRALEAGDPFALTDMDWVGAAAEARRRSKPAVDGITAVSSGQTRISVRPGKATQ